MTVERAGEGAGERVRGVVGDDRWSGGGCGGSSVVVDHGRGCGGCSTARGIWRGGIAIEMKGIEIECPHEYSIFFHIEYEKISSNLKKYS